MKKTLPAGLSTPPVPAAFHHQGVAKENDMKPILRTMGMAAALALGLVVLANLSLAQDAKAPPSPEALLKALAEAGKPGADRSAAVDLA